MHTHCLYCGKRLGFFHDKKKPYCSDLHEDRYLEKENKSGMDRLMDEYPVASPHTLEELRTGRIIPKEPVAPKAPPLPRALPLPMAPPLPLAPSFEGGESQIDREPDFAYAAMPTPSWGQPAPHDDDIPPDAPWIFSGPDCVLPVAAPFGSHDPNQAAFVEAPFAFTLQAPLPATAFSAVQPPVQQEQREPEYREEPRSELEPATLPFEHFSREFCRPDFPISLLDLPSPCMTRRLQLRLKQFQAPLVAEKQPGRESLVEPIPLRSSRQMRYPNFSSPRLRSMRPASAPLAWPAVAPETAAWTTQPIRTRPTPLIPALTLMRNL